MQIGEESKKNFLEKLKWDLEFLTQLKIMDCNLLLGILNVDQAEQERWRWRSGRMRSVRIMG